MKTLRFLSPLLFFGILHLDVCEQENLPALRQPRSRRGPWSSCLGGKPAAKKRALRCQRLVPWLQDAVSMGFCREFNWPGLRSWGEWPGSTSVPLPFSLSLG